MQDASRLYEGILHYAERTARYSIFRSSGIQKGGEGERRWIYAIDTSISTALSDSGAACFSAAPYDFIESDNTYHVRGDVSMNIFRMNAIGDGRLIKLRVDTISRVENFASILEGPS